MKDLKKIKLSNLSKDELEKRELNKLLGGENCCICSCSEINSTVSDANSGNSSGQEDIGGYGTGSYH